MDNQEKLSENSLSEGIYLKGSPYFKVGLGALLIIVLAFFLNFPIEQKAKSAIVSALKKNKACPITYSQFDLDLFLRPELNFKNLLVTGTCLGNRRNPGLAFDNVNLLLSRPTVVPPGVLFEVKAEDERTKLNIFATTGISSAHVKVAKSIIDGAFITRAGNLPVKLKGSLSVDAQVESDYKVPTAGSFHITSKDLSLPPQRVIILDIKGLNLAPLVLKGTLDTGVVKVQRFQVGNSNTKIEAIFTDGVVKLNKKNPKRHMVDLAGKLRLSAELLNEFPILAPFLGNANIDKNGFYRIELKGPISQLRPRFL